MSDVAQMLQQVMDRLDAIEARLDALAPSPEVTALTQVVADNPEVYRSLLTLVAQAPLAMEFMGEFVTTVLTQVDDDGTNLEMRLQECLTLFKRVTKPEVLAQVHMGLDLMEKLPETYGQGADYLTQLVDHVLLLDPIATVRIDEMMQILELATRPGVLATARKGMALIDEHPTAVENLIVSGEAALTALNASELDPELISKYVGVAMAAVQRLEDTTLDLEALAVEGITLLEKAGTPDNLAFASKSLDVLAGMNGSKDALLSVAELAATDPKVIGLLVAMGEAASATAQTAPRPVGMFGALGAMSDANTKLALGFALAFASQLGGKLGSGMVKA